MTIPFIGARDVTRRIPALFDWRADDVTLAARTGQIGVLTRASAASTVDSHGRIYSALANQPRWMALDLDSDHLREAATLLLETDARTNLVVQSERFDLTPWTAFGSTTCTPSAHTQSGVPLALLADDADTSVGEFYQPITFTGSQRKAVSIFIRRGSATSSLVRLIDTVTTDAVLDVAITWGVSGAPVLDAVTGLVLSVDALAGGVWRLVMQTTVVTAANAHRISVMPAAADPDDSALLGSLYAGGVQVENAPTPSAYIKTTTATVTRSADELLYPINFVPQEIYLLGEVMTHGFFGTAAGSDVLTSYGIFALGDSFTGAGRQALICELVELSGTGLVARYYNKIDGAGPGVDVDISGMTPPLMFLATLQADGGVALSVRDALGVVVTEEDPTPNAAAAAFYNNVLRMGAREGGGSPSVLSFRSLVISQTPLTLPTIGAAAVPVFRALLLSVDSETTIAGGSVQVTVQLFDSVLGQNVLEAGRTITWGVTGGDNTEWFSSATTDTDANGVAVVTFNAGAAAPPNTVYTLYATHVPTGIAATSHPTVTVVEAGEQQYGYNGDRYFGPTYFGVRFLA